MSTRCDCPICWGADGSVCDIIQSENGGTGYDCDRCGRFDLSGSAAASAPFTRKEVKSRIWRAALSHLVRSQREKRPFIRSDAIQDGIVYRLPSPAVQASNLVRAIGDYRNLEGSDWPFDKSGAAQIGALTQENANRVCKELIRQGLIAQEGKIMIPNRAGGIIDTGTFDLTLAGWEKYESESRAGAPGKYGFMALKFGVPELDNFVRDVLKPCVRHELSLDVFDMRDVGRAGLIDNIMRAQIRDSAFVIVDLTHDNSGAYWEAGYAEGLGKPVIYICEKSKFETAKTHFDTNHSTTVPWAIDEPERFRQELVATLRRSLGLF